MKMCQALSAIVIAAASSATWAQMTPAGVWRSIDDSTGEAKAEIRIQARGDAMFGSIVRSLKKDAKSTDTCAECQDERKDKPIAGLEIIRGVKQAEGQEVWEGGKILDPENGKEYRASLTPIDGGKKLQVRGYLGPFWRTQTWLRVE